jgi:TonB family protein
MTLKAHRSLVPAMTLSLLFHVLLAITMGMRYRYPDQTLRETYAVDLVYRMPALQIDSDSRSLSQDVSNSQAPTQTVPVKEKAVAETLEKPDSEVPLQDAVLEAEASETNVPSGQEPQNPTRSKDVLPVAASTESREAQYDFDGLLMALRERISASLVYPRAARKRGIEGTVVLRLKLDASGNLTSLAVVGTSGSGILDRSAQVLIKKVLPYRHGAGIGISMEIPIVYRLEKR